MADDDELDSQSVQLTRKQWRWLDERVKRNFSRSRAAELRRIVAAEMEREAQQKEATAAA